jgi:hypothetical protein
MAAGKIVALVALGLILSFFVVSIIALAIGLGVRRMIYFIFLSNNKQYKRPTQPFVKPHKIQLKRPSHPLV